MILLIAAVKFFMKLFPSKPFRKNPVVSADFVANSKKLNYNSKNKRRKNYDTNQIKKRFSTEVC